MSKAMRVLVWPLAVGVGGCATSPDSALPTDSLAVPGSRAEALDPRQREVPLPTASPSWRAALLLDNGETGIWTVKPFQVFRQYACPEVVGLDDLGRCHVMISYSGKWTPSTVIDDGAWLGGLAHGDIDPRLDGAELYTGGKSGNLYQVVAWPHGVLDYRLIAHLPGKEIHTIVAGELDPRAVGRELLVFTRPGGLYRVSPGGPDGTFVTELLEVLPGRVRDAVLLPPSSGAGQRIATVSRAGRLQLLTVGPDGPQWQTVYQAPMGMGRIALRPEAMGEQLVLYSTHDDGRILRHREVSSGGFETEVIYRGPQGPRGVVAGRFGVDPGQETVAIFGYSKRVELLTRRDGGWQVETLFVDRDKGHWLASAELDGRNDSDELLLSGYGGRIVMLLRPPAADSKAGSVSRQ